MLKYMHSKKGFTLIELMIVVAIIGILAAIAIPQYIKYIKRSRTSNGVDHARMICNAIMDWSSAPNMADGDMATFPPFPITTAGKDGKTFAQHFPSESGWINAAAGTAAGADAYYGFVVDVGAGNLGNGPAPHAGMTGTASDPAVGAVAWGLLADTAVYGSEVQAGGTGVTSAKPLSGCKSNVETVSTAY